MYANKPKQNLKFQIAEEALLEIKTLMDKSKMRYEDALACLLASEQISEKIYQELKKVDAKSLFYEVPAAKQNIKPIQNVKPPLNQPGKPPIKPKKSEAEQLEEAMALSLAMHTAQQAREMKQEIETRANLLTIAEIDFNESFIPGLKSFMKRLASIDAKIKSFGVGIVAYDNIIKNLHETQKLISEEEHEILQKISPTEFIAIAQYIVNNQVAVMAMLKKKGALRGAKEHTKLPRTFSLKLENGHVSFKVETKSKKANYHFDHSRKLDDVEKKLNMEIGGSKTGKPCIDISRGIPSVYFSLVSHYAFDTPPLEHPFAQEAAFSGQFGEYVAGLEGCMMYEKDGELLTVGYSKKALGSLDKFIGPKGLVDIQGREASMLDRLKLIKEVASGLLSMHEKNYVHSDVKPQNVLVYREFDLFSQHLRLSAKITDLEEAKNLSTSERGITGLSFPFTSPELFKESSDVQHPFYSFLHGLEKDTFFSYGYDCYQAVLKQNLAPKASAQQALEATKAQDIWALGILVHSVIYGGTVYGPNIHNPSEIALFKKQVQDPAFPLLKKMLNPNKKERITIEAVIAELDTMIQKLEPSLAKLKPGR